MEPIQIALVGAGSQTFGPGTVRDILLSETLALQDVRVTLMDIDPDRVRRVERYALSLVEQLGRRVQIRATIHLEQALEGAQFVITAAEAEHMLYWAEDFHIPRKYGFRQIYGENGGPGSLFHALRTMKIVVGVAQAMEKVCPDALLLNYTNPMHKVCEAMTRLTSTRVIGLCHGVWGGMHQVATLLQRPVEELEMDACGINHFTWFQTIRDRATGEDLYPQLRRAEREGDWLHDWHEIALSRILLRRFGLWPSPGANHCGEYLGWADEFYVNQMNWFYDPADGHPWQTGNVPDFLYYAGDGTTSRPWHKPVFAPKPLEEQPLRPTGELAIPIIESLGCGKAQRLDAVNIPNAGAIPNLADDTVVEVPATADGQGLHPMQMAPLPEPVAAIIRLQASINKILAEAYGEQSKAKVLEALLLEPTVHSYRNAVEMVDEMVQLQSNLLPPLH